MQKKEVYVPAIIGLIMIASFLFAARTLSIVIIFIPGVILTYIVYLKTAYKKDLEPSIFLPLYLLALAIQFIHFLEEYLTQFYTANGINL